MFSERSALSVEWRFDESLPLYEVRLVGYAKSLFGCTQEDAEDLMQTTFMNAWKAKKRPSCEKDMWPWLKKILTNTNIKNWKRTRNYGKDFGSEDKILGMVSTFGDPHSAAEISEVLTNIGILPLQQRAVLTLVAFSGLTIQDVAGLTGWPIDIVATLLLEARSALTQMDYGNYIEETEPRETVISTHMADMLHYPLEDLQRLNSHSAKALILRELHLFTYKDIGGLMRLPIGTVKSMVSRARQTLKNVQETK